MQEQELRSVRERIECAHCIALKRGGLQGHKVRDQIAMVDAPKLLEMVDKLQEQNQGQMRALVSCPECKSRGLIIFLQVPKRGEPIPYYCEQCGNVEEPPQLLGLWVADHDA